MEVPIGLLVEENINPAVSRTKEITSVNISFVFRQSGTYKTTLDNNPPM